MVVSGCVSRRGDLGDPHVKRSRLLRQMADLLGWLSEVRKRVDYMLSHPLGGDFETVSVQVQLHTGPNGLKSQLDEKRPDVERMLADSKELQNGGEVVSQSDRALLNSISQVQEELRRTWTELMTKSDNWNKQLGKAYEELKLFEVHAVYLCVFDIQMILILALWFVYLLTICIIYNIVIDHLFILFEGFLTGWLCIAWD